MQRFKQPNMDLHPDGEWVRYEDHAEAMKRIAGDGGQQADPMRFTRYEAMEEAGRQASEEMRRLEKYLEDTSKSRCSIACAICGTATPVLPADEGMDHICDSCAGPEENNDG